MRRATCNETNYITLDYAKNFVVAFRQSVSLATITVAYKWNTEILQMELEKHDGKGGQRKPISDLCCIVAIYLCHHVLLLLLLFSSKANEEISVTAYGSDLQNAKWNKMFTQNGLTLSKPRALFSLPSLMPPPPLSADSCGLLRVDLSVTLIGNLC